jgi:hypothetical protein
LTRASAGSIAHSSVTTAILVAVIELGFDPENLHTPHTRAVPASALKRLPIGLRWVR